MNAGLPAPALFAIFGGDGDLAWRKLVPALFDLYSAGHLPEPFAIIALGWADFNDDSLRLHYREGVGQHARNRAPEEAAWTAFAARIRFLRGDFADPRLYAELAAACCGLERDWQVQAQRIYYMATPPSQFGVIPGQLKAAGLTQDLEHARIVVEKPIGYDLDSALALNAHLADSFDESQIFRIDHYLGKETVQNILALRFANPMFEPIWNRRYVDYVTITVAETDGVGHRGGYYDRAGALRDMVQNHLMQILCLIAMEPMVSFDADEIRNKKADVLHAIRPIPRDEVGRHVVRGQYGEGWLEGQKVPGYGAEEGVASPSRTETFVALQLLIDNWRWQGVPFYLRTGKRLARAVSEVAIQFRPVPHRSFPAEATLDWQPSRLIMVIQPEQGIVLRFQAKVPGPKMHLRTSDMVFNYREAFATASPDPYETLLWDVLKGDMTLFMRHDQVVAAWQVLTPILEAWALATPNDFPNYPAGTWGPEATQDLLASQGHRWPLPFDLAAPPNPARPLPED